jgi:hypothetical protein
MDSLQQSISQLLENYSFLLAGMQSWSFEKFMDIIIGSKIRQLFMKLGAKPITIIEPISRKRSFNRNNALKRADNFLEFVVEVLDDYALLQNSKPDNRIRELRESVQHYRSTIPPYQKNMTSEQAIMIATAVGSAVISFVGLAIPLVRDYPLPAYLLVSLGVALAIPFGSLFALTFGYIIVQQAVWYHFLLYRFKISRKEREVLKQLRPLTNEITDALFRSEEKH